jgi:hypothetical protein
VSPLKLIIFITTDFPNFVPFGEYSSDAVASVKSANIEKNITFENMIWTPYFDLLDFF